jgi:hypothetical protein
MEDTKGKMEEQHQLITNLLRAVRPADRVVFEDRSLDQHLHILQDVLGGVHERCTARNPHPLRVFVLIPLNSATFRDSHSHVRRAIGRTERLDVLDHEQTIGIQNLAEHCVLAVQPLCLFGADEKL